MKIAFQIDRLNNINMQRDSSIAIANELLALGQEVLYYHPEDLKLVSQNGKCEVAISSLKRYCHNLSQKKIPQESEDFNTTDLDTIMIRQDPPFNMDYITSCYILSTIKDKVKIINDPDSLVLLAEKLIPFYLSPYTAQTIITNNAEDSKKINSSQLVIKPLYAHGGRGITILDKGSKNIDTVIDMTKKTFGCNYIIMQEFLPNADKTDKRVLIYDEQIITAFERYPSNNKFVANTAAGGSYGATTLTTQEQKACEAVIKFAKEKNLKFIGLDLIDEKITEVNITSPTGIMVADEIYQDNFAKKIANIIVDKHHI